MRAETEKLKTASGLMQVSFIDMETVYSLTDDKQYAYFAITHPAYSQRLSRTLLDEMRSNFFKDNEGAEKAGVTAKSVNALFMITLSNKYNDPKSFDSLSQAQSKIGELTLQLQSELKKASNNSEQLNVIDYFN